MNIEAMLKATEALDSVVGVLVSYRAKIIAQGFSAQAAEQMCVALNQVILTQAFASAASVARPRR